MIFLPKNTTSRSQPLNAGIIRAFKSKYRKLLVNYVISRIDDGKRASTIIHGVESGLKTFRRDRAKNGTSFLQML